MANINIGGFDLTTGQKKSVTSSDVATDSSGNPIGGASSTNWGSNTELLSANKTLTDADGTIQYLNPNGTDRSVTLPASAVTNKQYIIFNSGSQNALLLITDDNGLVLQAIENGDACRTYSDGTTWLGELLLVGSEVKTGQIMNFAGNATTNGFYDVNGSITDATSSTLAVRNEHVTLGAGNIIALAWEAASALTSTVITPYVETGAETGTFTLTGTSGVAFPSSTISVSIGQRVALRLTSGTTSVNTRLTLFIAGIPGISFPYGASMTIGDHASPGGNELDSSKILNNSAEWVMPIEGTITMMSYRATGTAARDIKIIKNGALAQTLNNSGSVGNIATSVAVREGDAIALEYDAGTSPGSSTWNLRLNHAGYGINFGGGSSISGDYLNIGQDDSVGTSPTLSGDNQATILKGGIIKSISYSTTSGTTTTNFGIYIDGSLTDDFFLKGAQGVYRTNIKLKAGDKLAINVINPDTATTANVYVYIS